MSRRPDWPGPEVIERIRANAAPWIRSQREIHRPGAAPVDGAVRQALQRCFAPATLDVARVVELRHIENPGFYRDLEAMGFPIPLDLRSADGITYGDVIVLRVARRTTTQLVDLLFHEMVHVVQYAILGIDGFADEYVDGWIATGFDYYGIPLERDARDLQGLFAEGESFSTEAEVARRIRARH